MNNRFRSRKWNIALLFLAGWMGCVGLFGESKHSVKLGLFGSQSVLAAPEAIAQLPPQKASLRYDGLYYSFDQEGNFTRYFRFYEDGIVLSFSVANQGLGAKPMLSQITGVLSNVSRNRDNTINQGTYVIEDDSGVPRIQFITASQAKNPARVSYTGTLNSNSISLSSLSLSTGFAEQRDYLFAPVQFTDPPKPIATDISTTTGQPATPEGLASEAEPDQEPAPEVVSQDAGLHYSGSTTDNSFNRITVLQGRYVMEQTIRERGVEFVDRCSGDQEAVGQRGITDYGSDQLPSQPISPTLTGRADAKVWFFSKKTPPAAGLRVIIRNKSQAGRDGGMPYSDRDYSKGLASESLDVALDRGHKNRFLSIDLGVNQFEYEIKRGTQIVETGEFMSAFRLSYKDLTRVVTLQRPKVDMACVNKKKK